MTSVGGKAPFGQPASKAGARLPAGLVIGVWVAIAGWLFSSQVANAEPQADAPPIAIGFQGKYKLGKWAPVRVADGSKFDQQKAYVVLPDGDGQPAGYPLEVAGGTATALVRVGRPTAQAVIQTGPDSNAPTTVLTQALPPGMQPSQFLYLMIGEGEPVNLPQPSEESLRATVVKLQPDELPSDPRAYDGVDGIMVNVGDGRILQQVNEEQWDAILGWVEGGGRLVISSGVKAEVTLAKPSPFQYLPFGTLEKTTTLKDASGLLAYIKLPDRDQFGDPARLQKLNAVQAAITPERETVVEARNDSQANSLPLVLSAPTGFGEATLLTVDFASGPLADWPARGHLFLRLFRHDLVRLSDRGGVSFDVGYDDLTGQLRSALDQFADVKVFSFWAVAGLIAVVLLLIGPFDYWLTTRLLKRPHLTWLTFPLEVALCIGGVVLLSHAGKGDKLRVRQMEILDIDLDADSDSRGTTWYNVFSPADIRDEIAAERCRAVLPTCPPESPKLSWQALPGNILGGMNAPDAAWLESTPQAYCHDAERWGGKLIDYPLPVNSSRQLVLEWKEALSPFLIDRLYHDAQGMLAGSFNHGDLEVELQDAVIFYQKWAYRLGTIPAGAEVKLDDISNYSSIETYLNRRVATGDKLASTPYDPTELNPRRILDMLTFYDLAGGRSYVHLLNRYHAKLEMSHLLRLNRAILIAKLPQPLTQLNVYGQTRDPAVDSPQTFVRIVLPVRD